MGDARDRDWTSAFDLSRLAKLRDRIPSLADARDLRDRIIRRVRPPRTDSLHCPVPIVDMAGDKGGAVDHYWTVHTVNSVPFRTARESLDYLDGRFAEYPGYRDLMELYGLHDDEVVLDYGCGPGNDLVGFFVHSNAKRIIGIDVSMTALRLASHRLGLHSSFNLDRIELIRKSDHNSNVPLPDASVDHLYCEGVLHHTSDPIGILREFRRILRPEGTAALMVYNSLSLWKHLYVGYEVRVLQRRFHELSVDQAFAKCTDGVDCPIAHNYLPEDFSRMCREAGFERVEFAGGYLSRAELDLYAAKGARAIGDERLESESRAFLAALTHDNRGYPLYNGKYAGCGGVYLIGADRG